MLDANLCIRVIRDKPKAIGARFREKGGTFALSTVVLYELLYGAARSDRPEHHRALIASLQPGLAILPFDEAAADHAADIRADLANRGAMIGPNDLLIAGHARSLDLTLITGNLGEFTRVQGLRCEDWEG